VAFAPADVGQRFAIGRQFRVMPRVKTGIALAMLPGRARGEPDSGARPAVSRSVDTSARGSHRPQSWPREADSPLADLFVNGVVNDPRLHRDLNRNLDQRHCRDSDFVRVDRRERASLHRFAIGPWYRSSLNRRNRPAQ
jgi:hypothetical protein